MAKPFDRTEVRTSRKRFPVDGATLGLMQVEPVGEGVWPTVLMIHENRGMMPYMIDVALELAAAGYRVVAPDLLSRIGGTEAYAHAPDSISTREIDGATHVADLKAVYDDLASDTTPLAVVGFCFGAEMGWQLLTERNPAGAVLYYGIGPDPAAALGIKASVYGVYAQDDPRVNDTLFDFLPSLAGAGCDFVLESYPGTKHAFHDHTRPDRFHPAAAAIVWYRTLAFLTELFDSE